MRLSSLKPGDKATIAKLHEHDERGDLSVRMMEMGLTAGSQIEVAYEAPFGGAIAPPEGGMRDRGSRRPSRERCDSPAAFGTGDTAAPTASWAPLLRLTRRAANVFRSRYGAVRTRGIRAFAECAGPVVGYVPSIGTPGARRYTAAPQGPDYRIPRVSVGAVG